MSKNNFLSFTTNDLLDIKAVFEELLENKHHFSTGLCRWIYDVKWKNYTKYDLALSYITQNKPKSFLLTLKRCFFGNSAYFWTPGEIKPRIKFIKKHIKLIEDEIAKRTLAAINSDETIIM